MHSECGRTNVRVQRSAGLRKERRSNCGIDITRGNDRTVALAAGGIYHLLTERRRSPSSTPTGKPGPSSTESERFSPAENLERIEIGELRAAANDFADHGCL